MRSLYTHLLGGWNARDGAAFAAPFTDDGVVIGFDGSEVTGRAAIAASMAAIFASHPTPEYIAIVRGVRLPVAGVAILRADTGLVPRGSSDLNPALNARQTVVAVRGAQGWSITHFQNTPAQLHGRADLAEALTAELRAALAQARAAGELRS